MVDDKNDHNPQFEKMQYNTSVKENQPVGTIVAKVRVHLALF